MIVCRVAKKVACNTSVLFTQTKILLLFIYKKLLSQFLPNLYILCPYKPQFIIKETS